MPTDALVVDASALVDLLLRESRGLAVLERLSGHTLHAPAHLDLEVFSALGRLRRAEALTDDQVEERLGVLAGAEITRHLLPTLLAGAWKRRHDIRLADGIYVALAEQLELPLITTDGRLARTASVTELIS